MTDHYFSPRPAAPHRPGLVRVVLPDVYLELATDAGVFSPGRLDPGTRLLLEAPIARTLLRLDHCHTAAARCQIALPPGIARVRLG